ncbi:hypothetical protein OQA88_4592 [Cercophora sp. LCS_1]
MPSKEDSAPAADANTFVDDYLEGWDDDLFKSPSPEPGDKTKKKDDKAEKRKVDALGIDEEIEVGKKPRVPRVKLDETRLLSEKGIPKLRKVAPKLKLKGKGHEFGDAARLLSFYQEWLDDLFPKATFLDSLAMVEKLGHKTTIRNERLRWIDEGRPKPAFDEDEEPREGSAAPRQPSRIAPIFEKSAARAKTPENSDDLFMDNIFDATPRTDAGTSKPADDVPEDDDLDALMAEAGGTTASSSAAPAFGSIFGNGLPKKPSQSGAPDDDDLEALMAEAETSASAKPVAKPTMGTSIFGDGRPKPSASGSGGDAEEDDLDALMAEAEAETPSKTSAEKATAPASGSGGRAKAVTQDNDFGDDGLDALMAEAEAGAPSKSSTSAKPAESKPSGASAEEEEAMAEMDGLW